MPEANSFSEQNHVGFRTTVSKTYLERDFDEQNEVRELDEAWVPTASRVEPKAPGKSSGFRVYPALLTLVSLSKASTPLWRRTRKPSA